MNTLKTNTLTLAVAGGLMCLAPDLLAQDVAGRWYLGLDAGLALQRDITLKYAAGEDKLSFDPGFRLGLSGGVHLSKSWKAGVELGFIYNSGSDTRHFGGEGPEYFQVPIMANGIYTFPIDGSFSAYVGAGVGGVSSVLWNDVLDAEGSFTFGYQGIVGAKYAISDTFDLGLSYKLLGTIEHDLGPYEVDGTLSHAFLAALTFKF